MTNTPSHRDSKSSSMLRGSTLPPPIRFGDPGSNHWGKLDPHCIVAEQRRGKDEDLVRRSQLTQSIYLSPVQRCGFTELRPLAEHHRSLGLTKSADFQFHNQVVAMAHPHRETGATNKKHSESNHCEIELRIL